MMGKSLMVLIFGAFCLSGYGQEFNKAKLDSYFDTLEAQNKFMGSVAVSQNGNVIYQRSVGFSDLESGIKANAEAEYGIGSVTQIFTAILVLKAVEEKKLSLGQTLDRYYPKIPNAGIITLNHLLSHQSGLHNFSSLTLKKERRMIRNIVKAGTDFVPGSKSVYNELNYMILTYILEETYNRPYEELLTMYITGPVGLQNTRLGSKKTVNDNCSRSYRYFADWKPIPDTDIPAALGAGGIISTPADLVRLSDALFGGKILSSESLRLMMPVDEQYGLGLLRKPFNERTGYGWYGEIDGFASEFIHYPDSNVSYAMASNGTNFNAGNIADAVLHAVYDQPFEVPVFKRYQVSPEDLDKYLGVYANLDHEASLRISKDNNILVARGKGLPLPFALDATEKDRFTLDLFNMEFAFDPVEELLLLKLPGQQILYTKKHMDLYFYNIGSMHLDSANFTEAIDYFTKAIMLNQGNTEYFFLRGGAYFQLEKYNEAISDFGHCFEIIPDESEYAYLMGMCYDRLNDVEMALSNYDNAIQLSPVDSRYYKSRADLYFKTQDYLKALDDYDRTLRIDPHDAVSFYQRGVTRYLLNEEDKACADWQNALQNGFQEASGYFEKICSERDE